MSDSRSEGFVLTRLFDAPVVLLWRCFTEQERLAKWVCAARLYDPER